MPAPHVAASLGDRELGGFQEIDRHQTGDISDGKAVARRKRPVHERAVEDAEEVHDAGLVGLGPGRHLWHLHVLHGRMGVAKYVRDRKQQMELQTSVPHFNLRNTPGPLTKYRRLRMKRLEIATDC